MSATILCAKNEFSIQNGVAHIKLGNGIVALCDECDWLNLLQHRWHADHGQWNTYARTRIRNGGATIRMHQAILGMNPGYFIDHKNGNGVDNRRCNIRVCTKTENAQNSSLRRDSASGYKGVSLRPHGKWESYIRVNKRRIYLGLHDTAETAAISYDLAAIKHFGEFARLNFPKEKGREVSSTTTRGPDSRAEPELVACA